MLQNIKKYIKGWFLGIILFFIFISFTFWGVGDIFSGNANHIIKVGKTKISRDLFLNEFQSNVNNFKRNKENLTKVELNEIANETIRNIANRYLILNAAKSMNIKVSNNVLKKKIIDNEVFQNKSKNGEFDKNLYLNFVGNNFGNEEKYLEFLENQILIELISKYFEERVSYPKNLTKNIYNKIEEKRSFQIASIDKIFFRSKLDNPNKDILEEYYNKNKEKYFFDERRSFSYIYVNLDSLKKNIDVTEDEILSAYEEQKEDFTTPEKRKVVQLFFNNEKLGNESFKKISKDNFKEIAEKNEDISHIDLGLVEKQQLFDEFADPVYSLKENNHTNLIKSDIGWHILKVTKIIESKFKELEKVKEQIKEEISLNKAYDDFDLIIKDVEDEISNGARLEEIKNKLNLNIKKEKLLEKRFFYNSNLPDKIKINSFFKEVYNRDLESDLFVEEIEDGFFVIEVDEIIKGKKKTFDESYNEVLINVKEEDLDKKIKVLSKEFKEKFNEGEDFLKISDSLEMESRNTKKINREDFVNQGFTLEFTDKVFQSKKNSINENNKKDKFHLVLPLSEIEIEHNDEIYLKVKESINKIYTIDNFNQITNDLEKKFPISVNEKILNEFVERLQY